MRRVLLSTVAGIVWATMLVFVMGQQPTPPPVTITGTPTSGQVAEFTAARTIQGVATTGTAGTAYVRATSPTLVTPNLGTPSTLVLTNATGLPISTGVSGLGAGIANFLATPSSANLATAVTDETGTGVLVLGTRPTISLQDSTTTLQDNADNTKQAQFQLSGITPGQTRIVTLPDANYTPAGIDVANAWGDGVRQTFNPNATAAGLNVGSQAGDPSTLVNGDLWYDSTGNLLRARINGTSVSLGAGGGGSGTVNSGTAGALAYYPSATTTVDDTTALTTSATDITSLRYRPTTKSATATLTTTDGPLVACDTSGGNVVLTLPAANGSQGSWAIIKTTSDANTCSVQRGGSDTINGGTTAMVLDAQWERVDLIATNTASPGNWSALLGVLTVDTSQIKDDAVTYAKLQNVSAASKLLGRGSASGAGDTEEITLGTNLSMSGTTLNATGSGSPVGSVGQVQYHNTTFAGSSGHTFDGTTLLSSKARSTTVSASKTLGTADGPLLDCNATSGAVVLTLPSAASTTQGQWMLVKTDSSANACSFAKGGSDTINGGTTSVGTSTQWGSVDAVLTSSTNWSSVASGSGGAGVTDGDKTDITVSGSGATWTIDPGVVTYAKMQNITTDRLLGRETAGTGSPEELTVSGGLEWITGGIQRSALTGDCTAAAGSNTLACPSIQLTSADISDVSVSTATNPSTETQLKQHTIPAGALNVANLRTEYKAFGRYTTTTGQTPTMRFRLYLCTVSGCGSGTVLTLADFTTAATTASVTNSWTLQSILGTAATGATGTLETRHTLLTQLGAAGGLSPEVRMDQNNAVSSSIDLTAQLFLRLTILNSSSNASNNVTQRMGTLAFPRGQTTSKMWLPAVACTGTTGTLLWDTLATNAPTATCSAGSTETTMMRGVADFPDSDGDYSLQQTVLLPTDWTGAIDAKVVYRTTATTDNTVWQVATRCIADAEADDLAYDTATAFTADAAKGTANQRNTAPDSGATTLNTSTCAAGELMHLKVFRNRTHASDTIAGVVSLMGLELTLRRTP